MGELTDKVERHHVPVLQGQEAVMLHNLLSVAVRDSPHPRTTDGRCGRGGMTSVHVDGCGQGLESEAHLERMLSLLLTVQPSCPLDFG